MFKFFLIFSRQYILILLTAILFFFIQTVNCFSKNNIFFVNNIKISKKLDINFSRDNVIDEIFEIAFKNILSKVLTSKEVKKVKNVKIKEIKKLVESFKILEESFSKDVYKASFEVFFNEKNLGYFLRKQNLLFSRPEEISIVFFPVLYENNDIKLFSNNNIYKFWKKNQLENQLINYVLPVEDIDIISEIREIKNDVEKLNVKKIAAKYNNNNYAYVVMELNKKKLQTFIKLNLNNNKIFKNFSYKVNNINNEEDISYVINQLKSEIEDSWKIENVIKESSYLTLNIHFDNRSLKTLAKLENSLNQIKIIKDYAIEIFDINKTIIKINYYGDPKKLYNAFEKFNYRLENDRGVWVVKVK